MEFEVEAIGPIEGLASLDRADEILETEARALAKRTFAISLVFAAIVVEPIRIELRRADGK
jgi:hypothetical protein